MGLLPGQDIDTVYTVTTGKLYPFYPIGQRTHVWVKLEATSPIAPVRKGFWAVIGTEDGKIRSWAYTNAAEITDSHSNNLIRCLNRA
jgi:hypothetical protein